MITLAKSELNQIATYWLIMSWSCRKPEALDFYPENLSCPNAADASHPKVPVLQQTNKPLQCLKNVVSGNGDVNI